MNLTKGINMIANIVPSVRRVLIDHCAPVLLKRKPAALFTLRSEECLFCLEEATGNTLEIEILRKNENSILLMVYDFALLEDLLTAKKIQAELSKAGYPDSFTVGSSLSFLKSRFSESTSFPHEIGIFLGYPLEDVQNFILHKGENYKCCGLWKVYGNEEYSRKCFMEYKYCGERMRRHLARGGSAKDFYITEDVNITGNFGGFYE